MKRICSIKSYVTG